MSETKSKEKEYPITMKGVWLDKWPAYALVDTPEQEEELRKQGYEKLEY